MKTITTIIFVLMLVAETNTTMYAQSFGKKLGKTVENAENKTNILKTEKKTDQAVSKSIDKVTDPNTYKGDGKDKKQQSENKSDKKQTAQEQISSENENKANAASVTDSPKALEMTYAKSDFVPGDEIIFEDMLVGEKLGEFPSQWDLDRGNAEIVTINGEKCISLIGYTIIMPLMKEKNYLPDEFTIEFDIYGDVSKTSYVTGEIGFNDGRAFVPRTSIYKDRIRLNASWRKPDDNSGHQSEDIKVNGNEWNHISISFNKRALKYYINGVRSLNIPNMKKPNSIWFWAEAGNYYIKNIRIAKGAVPLYDRMMTDGKFITYGITFDVGKSTIKPESMGEINRIVTLMTENPELKFSVEGHTDTTGNATNNQILSEARSKAIVDKLIELGVSSERLVASGKGQNNPIADNTTDEGRAKNRRVEFVKM